MENNKNIEAVEITVKAQILGEFNNWQSWIANVNSHLQKFGVTHALIHIDANGFSTSGYILRNTNDAAYPVKTYVLLQDPNVVRPMPFKSPSHN